MAAEHVHGLVTCRRCGGREVEAFSDLLEFTTWLEALEKNLRVDTERNPIITAFSRYYLSFHFEKHGKIHPYFITYMYCSKDTLEACKTELALNNNKNDEPLGMVMIMNVQTGETEVKILKTVADLDELPENLRNQILADNPDLSHPKESHPSESLPKDQKVDDERFRRLMNS